MKSDKKSVEYNQILFFDTTMINFFTTKTKIEQILQIRIEKCIFVADKWLNVINRILM